MRKFIDIIEARKPKSPAPVPVDFSALLERLKRIAERVAKRPFDIEWEYRYGQAIKQKVSAQVKQHEDSHEPEFDGEFTPLDERDLYVEFLPDVWRNLVTHTFAAVRIEIEHDILAYQKRHGERLDREAGHAHDMNYIEDSDWLRAMEEQKRFAEAITHSTVNRPSGIATLVDRIEAFANDWPSIVQTDQRDEPTLVEGMTDGLAAAIPLLLLVAKKSA